MNFNKDMFYVEFGLVNRLITCICLEMTNELKTICSFNSDFLMQIQMCTDRIVLVTRAIRISLSL